MSREKRPAYFRFFLEACDLISILDVESAGRVIQAVSAYFSDNIEPRDLRQHRTENCVQKMSLRGKIKT